MPHSSLKGPVDRPGLINAFTPVTPQDSPSSAVYDALRRIAGGDTSIDINQGQGSGLRVSPASGPTGGGRLAGSLGNVLPYVRKEEELLASGQVTRDPSGVLVSSTAAREANLRAVGRDPAEATAHLRAPGAPGGRAPGAPTPSGGVRLAADPGSGAPAPSGGVQLNQTPSGGATLRSSPFNPTQQSAPFLNAIYNARNATVAGQTQVFERQGGALRDAVLRASPELASATSAFQRQLNDPLGGGLREDLADRIRVQQAQAGLQGGRSAAFQEGAFLQGAALQRRTAAAQGLQQVGHQIAQISGLSQLPNASLAALGESLLGDRTLDAVRRANEAQSRIAQDLFDRLLPQTRSISPGINFTDYQGTVANTLSPGATTSGTRPLGPTRTFVDPGGGQTFISTPQNTFL